MAADGDGLDLDPDQLDDPYLPDRPTDNNLLRAILLMLTEMRDLLRDKL